MQRSSSRLAGRSLFPAAAAQDWGMPLAWNPAFEALRGAAAGPMVRVNRETAITGEE